MTGHNEHHLAVVLKSATRDILPVAFEALRREKARRRRRLFAFAAPVAAAATVLTVALLTVPIASTPHRTGGTSDAATAIHHPTPLLSGTATEGPTSAHPTRSAVGNCGASALRARYVGGGVGGQTAFGSIVIWNVASQACQISGAVTLMGTYASGRADKDVIVNRSVGLVSLVLPARVVPPRDRTWDPRKYAVVSLAAPMSGPGGQCTRPLLGPQTFQLTLGLRQINVSNHDPAARQNKILAGCHGQIILESVQGPR